MANWFIEDVEPSDAPNSTAWGYLLRRRESESFRDSFLLSVAGKLLPNRTELASLERQRDKGERRLRILDQIIAMSTRKARSR